MDEGYRRATLHYDDDPPEPRPTEVEQPSCRAGFWVGGAGGQLRGDGFVECAEPAGHYPGTVHRAMVAWNESVCPECGKDTNRTGLCSSAYHRTDG